MARPKSIKWPKRVRIFLDHRLTGNKVFPVANRQEVARSTVSTIVAEFESMGFSLRPRLRLSLERLRQLQQRHLRWVSEVLREDEVSSAGMLTQVGTLGAAQAPNRMTQALRTDDGSADVVTQIGMLDLSPSMDEDSARKAIEKVQLFIGDELDWHLKETSAEKVIEDVRASMRDYRQREYEAFRSSRETMEQLCGLPEAGDQGEGDGESRLFPELGMLMRRELFNPAFKRENPPEDWLNWQTDPDDPSLLRLNGQRAARGSEADHVRVKEGVNRFRTDRFREHQQLFQELNLLRRDLSLLQEVVNTEIAGMSEEDIRQGICPACPYPELLLETKRQKDADEKSSTGDQARPTTNEGS